MGNSQHGVTRRTVSRLGPRQAAFAPTADRGAWVRGGIDLPRAVTAASDAQRDGLFGPVVVVPDDASVLDRTVGLAGRSPAWPH